MIHVKKFTFNGFAQNTYVVYDENGDSFLVDAGNSTAAEDAELFNFIAEKQLNIKKFLLTHAHIDHVLGLEYITKKITAPVYLHSQEEIILQHSPTTAQMYGLPYTPFTGSVQHIVEGESDLALGGHQIQVFHVPGHSPGSLVYYFRESGFLIGGDVLFQGSIGRTDLYMGDYNQLISGIKEKLFPLPTDTIVYAGHGNETTVGIERDTNPFF